MIRMYRLFKLAITGSVILGLSIILCGCQGGGGSQAQITSPAQNSLNSLNLTHNSWAGALDLSGINIVTVQPRNPESINVWHSGLNSFDNWTPDFSPDPAWTISDENHSVAIGDLDGDNKNEIIVPGYCLTGYDMGIFINAYEEGDYEYTDGIRDTWWTSYYANETWLVESPDVYKSNEIFTVDLDHNGDSEVVLISATQIAIFDFVPGQTDPQNRWKGEGSIRMISRRRIDGYLLGYAPGREVRVTSVDAGNFTGDSEYPDIAITVNLREGNDEWQGYVMVFSDPGLNGLDNYKYYQAQPGSELTHDGLRICDADGDGSSSIWTVAVTDSTDTLLSSHLAYWKWVEGDEPYLEENIALPLEVDVTEPRSIMAVGDILNDSAGDEIAILSRSTGEIKIYSPSSVSDGYALGDPVNILVDPDVIIYSMAIHKKKIFVGGAMQSDLSSYLAVIGQTGAPDNGAEFEYEWELRNGPGKEVWDMAVGP